jgi:LAO/AO transport system kinase
MLGGLAAHTLESVELCELAGYDWVFVESVGVGQSEIDVQWVADAVVLVVPPLGGDELQGLKRGMNEVCDVVVVNKADGEGRAAAARSASDAAAAFGVLRRAPPPVFVLSARDGTGVAPFFEWARNRAAELCDDPIRLAQKRRTQRRAYFDRVVRAALWARLEALQARPEHAELHEQVASGVLRAPAAAQALINVLLAPVDKTPG